MISYELRDMILQYVESIITVEQLEEWLVPRLPALLKSPDSTDSDVVAALELGLAEMSDGIRTEDELRRLLLDVIREQTTTLNVYPADQPQFDMTSSSNQTVLVQFPDNSEFAMWMLDRQPCESI
jgi:hypothetical protein